MEKHTESDLSIHPMSYLLLPLIALGHFAIHVAVINRLHGTGLPRWFLKLCDACWYLLMAGIPMVIATSWLQSKVSSFTLLDRPLRLAISCYVWTCVFAAFVAIADRLYRWRNIKSTELLVNNHTHVVSVADQIGQLPVGTGFTAFLAKLPLNEILHLSVHEKQLRLPRLSAELAGLRITHLSDLHLTGQLTKDFYREVVRQSNAWPSDIVAITGDIVEKVPCLDWIAEIFSELQATYGVYFVLGNHELRIRNESLVRNTLTNAGWIDLGKRWRMIEHQGSPLVLAGNELPWYAPAADFSDCPTSVNGVRPLRMLLTHSPDQLQWARRYDCDIMLAGHTHGGQVRLPLIGPILSPSQQGSRHASGTFYYEPTLMHVSRGIAGTRPLRVNCPPEIARLVLTSLRDGPETRPSLSADNAHREQ